MQITNTFNSGTFSGDVALKSYCEMW